MTTQPQVQPVATEEYTDDYQVRFDALYAAVLFHGMSNLADKAVPPRSGTVLKTALEFEGYLETGELPDSTHMGVH